MFITFEGGEGTGKSTQCQLLAARLTQAGREVHLTREPGGTPDADQLRALLVSGEPGRWTANEELLLNFAARGSHLRQVIRPALEAGKVVVCDRFVDSSYVYQVVAGGARLPLFTELINAVAATPVPDFTFILDIDPLIGMSRAASRGGTENRFERKGYEYHAKIRNAFRELAASQPKRCHLIDANEGIEDVARNIWAKLHG